MHKKDTTIPVEFHIKSENTFNKKLKIIQNKLNRSVIIIEEKNVAIKLMNNYINELIKKGVVSKQEVKEAIKNKKYSKEIVRKNREKYCKAL